MSFVSRRDGLAANGQLAEEPVGVLPDDQMRYSPDSAWIRAATVLTSDGSGPAQNLGQARSSPVLNCPRQGGQRFLCGFGDEW